MMPQKPTRISDDAHTRWIRTLPCAVCGDVTLTELAHVSYVDLRYGKIGRGKSQREESCWTIPLCGQHHRRQHAFPGGERAFWINEGIDPVRVCAALYVYSGDIDRATLILENARMT